MKLKLTRARIIPQGPRTKLILEVATVSISLCKSMSVSKYWTEQDDHTDGPHSRSVFMLASEAQSESCVSGVSLVAWLCPWLLVLALRPSSLGSACY